MQEYIGLKHNYYCQNTPELINYLNYIDKHVLDGNSKCKYIIFLSSDWAKFTDTLDDKKELIFSNNKFYENELKNILENLDELIPNKELEIEALENKLIELIKKEKDSNNKLVYIDLAVIHYLIGVKVRRYITDEMFEIINKINSLKKKRKIEDNIWKDCWVYNSNGKTTTNKIVELYSILSPIEVFEREGFNNTKLWEVEERKDCL